MLQDSRIASAYASDMASDGSDNHNRTENVSLRVAREAKAILEPTQQFLADQQIKLANTRAALALRSAPSSDLVERARASIQLIVAARVELEGRVERASLDVQQHSLVRDVRNALLRLKEEVDQLSNGG